MTAMKIKIPQITLDAFEIFGDEKLEAELDQQENAFKNVWSTIYKSIESGKNKVAYWDSQSVIQPGYHSFMRYALHLSTKHEGFLQLSVMEIRNGEIIPTSDSQHKDVRNFINKMWCCYNSDFVTVM